MKYKVGDKVRIKSLDWYNENKDPKHGYVDCGNGIGFYKHMTEYCGKVMTISEIWDCCYDMEGHVSAWNDEMIEGLVEEETKPNIIEEAKTYWDSIKDAWICPEGYIFRDEKGNVINATKIVLEKKKKEYPKTYEECCKELNIAVRDFDILYNMLDTTEIIYTNNLDRLLNSFRKLLICRDAYWKIAGEEMGLGKPWKPDWEDGNLKWCMSYSGNCIEFDQYKSKHHILAFPTEEMRDAFYENFKSEIENCKELL